MERVSGFGARAVFLGLGCCLRDGSVLLRVALIRLLFLGCLRLVCHFVGRKYSCFVRDGSATDPSRRTRGTALPYRTTLLHPLPLPSCQRVSSASTPILEACQSAANHFTLSESTSVAFSSGPKRYATECHSSTSCIPFAETIAICAAFSRPRDRKLRASPTMTAAHPLGG